MARSGHQDSRVMEQESASASSTAGASPTRPSGTGRCSSSAAAGSPTSRRSGPTRPASVLRGARADASRRALRPARGRALRARAAGPADRGARDAAARDRARGERRRAGDAVRLLVRRARDRALREPSRRSGCAKIVFFGAYAARDDIPEATRRSLVDFVRVNWQLAAQMLAGLFVPHGSGDEIAAFSRYQRVAAEAEVAAAFLELDLGSDVRESCRRSRRLRSCCTVAAIARCRSAAAASSPRCCRTPASSRSNGDSHLPWMDDQRELQRALAGFLEDAAPVRGERRLAAHAPRDRGAAARRRRPLEPRDRVLARAQRAHGAPPHREHPPQADAVVARGGRRARDPRGPDLDDAHPWPGTSSFSAASTFRVTSASRCRSSVQLSRTRASTT